MKKIIFFFAIAVFFSACEKDPTSNWKELDLLAQGVPLTIMAPDSADVKANNLMNVIKDITVIKEPNYNVQIFASGIEAKNEAKLKEEQLAEVKANRYFSKVVTEDENGFIYETAIDSTLINYGFRYVLQQGQNEFVFQQGLMGTFTLEDVKNMYKAVKQK